MGRIVVSDNVTLDGVVQDPAGDEGFRRGGWVGRIAALPELAKVTLDEALGTEALLLGRRSYEWFAARWPSRSGELADRLNSLPKYVVSSSLEDPEWNNSTVRPDGRPHVTPLISVWFDGALYFCTGPDERKAKNLAENSHCILTTGCNPLDDGFDIVVEGDAEQVTYEARLHRLADAYVSKYGSDWRFGVRDGAFVHQGAHEGSVALVYEVAPRTAFGFAKGEEFSQTRWRFERT